MNVKLLRKVKNHILAEPKRLRMWGYVSLKTKGAKVPMSEGLDTRPFAKCNTAACVAGWTCLLQIKPAERRGFTGSTYFHTAKNLLDLTDQQAHRLFMPDMWPETFGAGTSDDGKAKTAKVAAARIEHFIKTKGKE